jgi:polyisoprenoid-binding protein YceI
MYTTRTSKTLSGTLVFFLATAALAAGPSSGPVTIEGGSASFETTTNVPGIEVKGTSSSLAGTASVSHDAAGLSVEQIHIVLPVKSLATGMKVRDEHMRKYIFTTAEGQVPDMEFTADKVACKTSGGPEDFLCQVSGNLSIRGQARPFATTLNVKEQSSTFRASGEGLVKLSDYGIPIPKQFGVSTSNEVKLKLTFAAKLTTTSGNTQSASAGGAR